MLTQRHRALFEASYSALLLRSDPGERPQPTPAPVPSQDHDDHNTMTDRDFGTGTAG